MSRSDLRNKLRPSQLIVFGILSALSLQNIAYTHALDLHPETVARTVESSPTLVQRYQQMISSDRLASQLYFLASNYFEGRETTTRGQKLAAQYLAAQYRLMGLTPKGTAKGATTNSPESYFQPFDVYRLTPEKTQLEVSVNGTKVASSTFSSSSHDDLSFFLTGKTANASGEVVFVGYGIADGKLGYDDYAALAAKGISINGKWVMMLANEPVANATTSLLPTEGHQLSNWTTRLLKKKAILAAGKPAGILEVRLPSPLIKDTFVDLAAAASRNAQRVGNLSLNRFTDYPPTYAISAKLANQILSSSGHSVEDLRQQIDKTLKPTVFEVSGVTVNTTVDESPVLATENILAFIEGSDPALKDEVVIVSAHYDHLGINPALKGDQIFNGAADDGSGVVACLELAHAFMAARRDGYGPRRSILFVNFSGEEKGLLGSSQYAQREPVISLDKTVADINMDGVAGIDTKHPTGSHNYIYVVGAEDLSQELIATNKRIKEVTGIDLDLTPGPNFNSDQRSFQTQLVPFLYYSTGLTEHYHTPADEPKTIDYDHLARVVRLIFGTVWQVANQDTRPHSVDRSQFTLVGYVCPPCPYECDDVVYDHGGTCPICGMTLVPTYRSPGTSAKLQSVIR
ncbi:MAG TPA: M28 family peptidase [Pyrinomonadaceae bacterium]